MVDIYSSRTNIHKAILENRIRTLLGNIMVDIDGVMTSLVPSILKRINEKHQNTFTGKDVVVDRMENLSFFTDLGYSKDEANKYLKQIFLDIEAKGELETMEPFPFCVQSLKKFQILHDVSIATARGDGFYIDGKSATEKWMQYIKFEPDELIFNGKKHEATHKRNIFLFFEDNPDNALTLLNSKKNSTLTVILYNHPWNKMNAGDNKKLDNKDYESKSILINKLDKYEGTKLFRIDDWEQIYNMLVK